MAVFLVALLSGEAEKKRAMRARTSGEAANGFSMLPPQSPHAVSLPLLCSPNQNHHATQAI